MGKKANKLNIFKVAGAKSLKLKQKPKPVRTKLKDLNKIKDTIEQIDDDLLVVQSIVRQNAHAELIPTDTATPAKCNNGIEFDAVCLMYEQLQSDTDAVLEDMERINLTKL